MEVLRLLEIKNPKVLDTPHALQDAVVRKRLPRASPAGATKPSPEGIGTRVGIAVGTSLGAMFGDSGAELVRKASLGRSIRTPRRTFVCDSYCNKFKWK
jgi:hypothetical protein